jgi:tetratricopeptide (TPR) repeat protein
MAIDQELLAAGLRYHQSGQFGQAEKIYQQALDADPQNADVLSLLGAVCINLNQWKRAEQHLDLALRQNPQHHAALDNRGVLMARQNRFAEAIENFERAVAINPAAVMTHLNLANALALCGRVNDAIGAFQRVVQMQPNQPRAHAELVKLFRSQNRGAEVAAHLAELARLQPNDPRAHFELALALTTLGRIDEAIAAYRETLRLDPKAVGAYVNLANLCAEKKNFDESISLYQRAIELNPEMAEAYSDMATVLSRQGKLVEAAGALRQALRINPNMPEAHNNLGIVYNEDGRYAEAAASYRRAIAIREDNPEFWYNLGIALLKQKLVASSIEHFDHTLTLRPDHAEAHHNRSAALLLSENYEEGLTEYEWRFGSRDFPPARFRWPRWDGSNLAGRTIVLCSEQGMGDTLQFVRYAPMVKARGARVIVECQPALHAILARTPGVDAWTSNAAPALAADCCEPLMSLPYRMGTTYPAVPADVPYVFADPQLLVAWQTRLDEFGAARLKVGLAWQGNPRCPGDRWRSVPLAAYAPLSAIDGVRLFNLQKGPGLDQLAPVRDAWPIIDFGDAVDTAHGAFMDTAAIMKGLDLVITSDTATAHLAGALGVNVWVALPFVPDWRWGLEHVDCPWYPTMKLFRQSKWDDWAELFQRMAAELATLSAGSELAR